MKLELKPCPFCGKEIDQYSVEVNTYGIKRLQISCCMNFDITSDEVLETFFGNEVIAGFDAEEKWNRRVGEQE